MSEWNISLILCYITDILDVLIFIGCCFVLSVNVKLYTEILKLRDLGSKLDKKK